MSIVLVVKVSEGLVLAADSASTLHGRVESPQGVQEGILKTYYNARKLLQIGDFPIGVLTWGQAYIGPRTVESYIRKWEHGHKWQSRKEYQAEYDDSFIVRDVALGLLTHLREAYEEEYSDDQQPVLGVLVAGYSEGEFFPEIWRFVLPMDDDVVNQRPDVDGKPDFGASWFGMTDPIVRLHFGRDEAVVRSISETFGIPESEVRDALQRLEYRIPFAMMPLQDAIEYANYMLNVVIGRYRFVVGPELCGGEIDIAAITQREFKWISRKS
ncbi:MAG: hypothetical protein MAG451_03161 [Anaerolineales bacterium]|nr:hypothetical protein [Anaerolineales bacterium]